MRHLFWILAFATGITAVTPLAALELADSDEIRVDTRCVADSVTVGQRFVVTHAFSYSDTLSMCPVTTMNVGKNRVMSLQWKDKAADGILTRRVRLELISLDLAQAVLPPQSFDFQTPAGDTLRAVTDEIVLPVRALAATSQEPRPLKEQWVAPRNWLVWIVAGAASILLAAVALFFWRRRSRRVPEPAFVPRLPADYVALTELARIEKMGLVDKREFKRYYTLVVDAVRHYIEARYHVDAMDSTTFELLSNLDRMSVRIDGLERLFSEADLVKFAKHVPDAADAERAMHSSREIVVKTAPKHVPVANDDEDGTVAVEEAS